MSTQKNISLIGSGLVGSLLAIILAKRNHRVNIYERRPDMRKNTGVAGRSINLALSDRGWKALDAVGIGDEIRKIAIPMYGRYIHNMDGSTAYQAYGKENQAIYSVSRGGINCKLMDLAEQQSNVKIHFDERCDVVDLKTNTAVFENTITKKKKSIQSDLIISSDGAFSAGRLAIQLNTDRFNYQQYYIDCGYKELTIPAGENGSFLIEKNALHIWPRGKFMMIALPNFDGSFTCTLFFPFEGEHSFDALKERSAVLPFFKTYFADAVALMPTLLDDFMNNPTSSLVTVKCFPWTISDKLALIGDAAHAIVPFFGQGMNCGFEDCTVFNQLLDEYKEDWEKVFKAYEISRKPDSDAIADLAIGNFVEMRDLVGQPKFLLQKKIEANFSNKHPEKWITAYSMVTFSPEIRYSVALRKGKEQQAIMDEVMALPDIEKKWDSPEIESLILSKL
ncbi:MAG TPA: NAD(P)/FAD-dependent oxidoreductase [Bacteroidia bacterium]|nr:NAD(P)/FAD-dependent oxidoreductase [Bacteroidia bacterium]HRH07843.1 NAD(P)/FAD-dependent oxidoreductase [Bacteroidia bacterium]HRH63997.1 NAD(P)/FAD-dependent oxidoreductase [Bacteroidia bacterium]